MTDYDMEILAKTIFGEARGEPYEGQVAVACVILNRWKSKKWFAGKTIAATCLKPYQFSCWNKSDPNAQKIASLSYAQYAKYFDAIKEAEAHDVTNGATHYHVEGLHPKWAEGKKPCKIFAHHVFYKDID